MSHQPRHAELSRPAGGVAFAALVLVSPLVALVLLLPATHALAATIANQRPLLFSFDGSDTTAGAFARVNATAADYSSGDLYVVDRGNEAIDRFDSEGRAKNFAAGPAAGESSLYGPEPAEPFNSMNQFFFEGFFPDLAVDNSAGAGGPGEGEQGRLYVSGSGGPIYAFDREGNLLWPEPIPTSATGTTVRGITVDGAGNLWVGTGAAGKVIVFDTTGPGPPSPIPIDEVTITSGPRLPARLGIDQSGTNLYLAHQWNYGGAPPPGVDKYVSGVFDSTVTTTRTRNLAVNQSTALPSPSTAGHVFALYQNGFEEFAATGSPPTLLGSYGGDLIGSYGSESSGGAGIAYKPAKDWVYVSDNASNAVKVFGPPASGTAPDVTSQKTDEITETEATAHATISPREVPNSYHFEWIKGEAQKVTVEATGGTFKLSTGGFPEQLTSSMPFDISAAAMQEELEALFGAGNVTVEGTPAEGAGSPGEYDIVFVGSLAGRNVARMGWRPGELEGSVTSLSVQTVTEGESWTSAEPQPEWPETYPSIEPPDNSDHPVSLHLEGLERNTTYHVRSVGTATEPEGDPEKRLDAYASPPDTFTTLPPDPPVVENCAISAVTSESAHLDCTIDPQEDETTWRVLLSTKVEPGATQAECESLAASAFEKAAEGTIPSGTPGTVDIDEDPSGLEHKQTYCLRITATNANPERGEADLVFQTLAVAPTEAETAFAAPRSDTTARVNARVNPEGEAPLTYRFELSEDGVDWSARAERTSTTEAREPIVVADVLTGLTPNTTYHYRLGLLETTCAPTEGCGPAASLGAERTFTTRTSAEATGPTSCPNADARAKQHTEYLPDCRGIELVNNPEKGDQNASSRSAFVTSDGEKIVWSVIGAAPGAYNPEAASFLASRAGRTASAPNGWQSQVIAPPASEQLGAGNGSISPVAATSDLSQFVLAETLRPHSGALAETALSRWHQGRSEPLALYPNSAISAISTDVSENASRVITVNPETDQLEDLGQGEPGEVLSVMPGGAASECGLDEPGTFSGFGETRMISADASRVYFRAKRDGACGGSAPKALFLRNRDANGGAGQTALIEPGGGGSSESPTFLGTTPDGRSAYYLSYNRCRKWGEEEAPTPPLCEAPEATDQNADLDVYRWDEEASPEGESTCLTCVVTDAKVENARISADFSHLYFESEAALLPGTLAGHLYIYVLSAGQLRPVADITGTPLIFGARLGQARLSASGNVLLFGAVASPRLTSDRIAPSCPSAVGGQPCLQLYRYEDRDQSLECVSCLRGGQTSLPVNNSTEFVLSRDGSTIAFASGEALIPSDVNRARDLYEWREGRIDLLSDGITEFFSGGIVEISGTAPEVKAIDADGSDIFFSVDSPDLTGFEADGLRNAYDARVGGGFPPPTPPAHCTEDSCQGPLQAAPPEQQPASQNPSRGNVRTRRNCHATARRATRFARRAKRLRRHARRAAAHSGRRARRMRRRSERLARKARRLSRSAKRCRHANRRRSK